MADRTNLLLLSIAASVLAVYLVLSGGGARGGAHPSARIVPEQRADRLDAITIDRPAEPPVTLERAPDPDGFRMVAPARAPVDDAALSDLVGTLEVLSYRREVAPAAATGADLDHPRAVLHLRYDRAGEVVLRVGAALDVTDQSWLARGDRVFLVDGYAARALVRGAADLRARQPLPTRYRDVTGLEIHTTGGDLVLSGRPLAVHLPDLPGAARADAGAVRALLDHLDDLRLTRFLPDAVPPRVAALSVRVIGGSGTRELVELGPCPGHEGEVAVTTPVGAGCVSEVAAAELAMAVALAAHLVDPHLVALGAGRPTAIDIADGGRHLVANGGTWHDGDGAAVDADAVVDWAQALDAVPAGGFGPPAEGARVVSTVTLHYAGDRADRIELLAAGRDLLVRRAGEPIAFPAGEGARAVFAPPCARFRDRSLWSFDPSAVREVERRGARGETALERGELLEDWTVRSPAGAGPDGAAIGRLLEVVARPRAARFVADRATPAYGLARPRARVGVTFAPPGGAREKRGLEIGGAAADGCYARVGGEDAVLVIGAEDCETLLAAWTK